ncbi:hypothetical protein CRUP_007617 [Coryphaenoides rupestris]|nr:hypothetical protein CRUP_007617 [Coryphaenoides rupestris]
MFWKFDLHASSHLEALLEREDVTLTELMDEEDVLQECKAQNRRLLFFLSQDHCMQELLRLITTVPPTGVEEMKRFKYPNIACELLTSDVGVINDKLGNEEPLLDTLYGFLEQPSPLNPLLASFFSKTVGNLITRKTEQVISFLRGKEGFLSLVLKHIDTSAMMDVLLRLISCVEPASLRQKTLHWLNEEKLAQRLIELIHPERDEERQSNASQTLCDIIRLSRDQANQMQEISESDPLLTALESQECVGQLLQNMFSGDRTETCIVNGVQVLLTLLEIRRPVVDGVMDAQGFERSYNVNSSILLAIQPQLIHFHRLLLDPPKCSPMLTSLGILEEPLGNSRLHVARLDLFFKYTWNNFLHLQVELCVAAILRPCAHEMRLQPDLGTQETPLPPPLQEASKETASAEAQATDLGSSQNPDSSAHNAMVAHLFQHCRLVQRILDAWEENDKIQLTGGMRRGYMGHLTRIANTVVHNLEKGPVHAQISGLITELPEDCRGRWDTFVEQTLKETNRKNTIDLAFSDYQIQQMTANFVDQFGFNDEEFTDAEDRIAATFDQIAEININIDAGHDSANTAVFEACSKEKIQSFDDDEEDIWEEKEINYATQTKSRNRCGLGGRLWGGEFQSACSGRRVLGMGQSRLQASFHGDGGEGVGQVHGLPALLLLRDGPPVQLSSCAWSVCVARKAPLVASDTSSSGSSDSDEEEDKTQSVSLDTVAPPETPGTAVASSNSSSTLWTTGDASNDKSASASEADKVAAEWNSTEDKGKGNGKDSDARPSAASERPAAAQQDLPLSANGPA